MDIDPSPQDHLHRLGESATYPIEPRCGALAALRLRAGLSQSQRLWPSPDTNSPYGLFVSGLSPQRRRPCRARLRLQAQTVAQAGSLLPEFPAPP